MALLGTPTIADITSDFIIQPPGFPLAIPEARR